MLTRILIVMAALCAGGAAWLSQGTISFTGAADGRIALLPLSGGALLVAAGAGFATWFAGLRGGPLAAFLLLALLVLPWIPGMPAVFSLWSGPLAWIVWTAIAVIVLSGAAPRALAGAVRMARPQLAAGALACLVYGIAAWQVAPSVPGGDEPHYLVITQSLVLDGDLKIENNHQRGDYRRYFAGPLAPDFILRGRDGEIYSIHAPGVSALVAPAFAIGGYGGVVAFLILIAAAGSALAWHVAWIVTGRSDAAWFGWAAVTLSTTGIFHSFAVYPDGPGAVVALTGIWALLRARRESEAGGESVMPWILHGAALALLPWLHTRFALIAGGLGAMILWRLAATKHAPGKAVAFLAVPAVSALAWVSYFIVIYGTPDPSAPYGGQPGSLVHVTGGTVGLFFDQRFGLLAYSPVLAFALAGLVAMAARREHRRLGIEILFVLVPYLVVVAHFPMWWGGNSAPARLFVPMLLLMSVPAAVAWTAIRNRATRATAWAALAFTGFASAVLVFVDGGRLAYNVRDAHALWLEWLNPALELGRGLPAFWRGRPRSTAPLGWGQEELGIYRDTAVWVGLFVAAWLALRALERSAWLRSPPRLATATAGTYALAAMLAVSLVWSLSASGGSTTTPAQLELLRRLGREPRVLTLDGNTYRRVEPDRVPGMLQILPERATVTGGAGRGDRPLYMLPSVPAGEYRLRLDGAAPGAWLMLGIGRDQFAIRTEQLGSNPEPLIVRFPVDVRALIVRGDESLRRSVGQMVIEPLSLVRPAHRLTGLVARRAARFGGATVFFMDEGSFPEPGAFWVGGGRSATVVLQPDERRPAMTLRLRNAPVENRVAIQSGGWHEDLALAPGEVRHVEVPLDTRRGATLIRFSSSSGFRPAEVEPGSRDGRFLGVYVQNARQP